MMKSSLLQLFSLAFCVGAQSQSGGGLENYYYVSRNENATMVPLIHYTTSKNWYGEARYNYDDQRTFSLYAGKTFSKEGKWSYSATPLIGGMVGLMNGASMGLNADIERGKLFLSSQSQYSFSVEDRMNKYFFTWSEMGYQPLTWCYTGVALQQTSAYKEAAKWETGYTIGFTFRNWTIPLYVFSPSKEERYFIVGLNWEWKNSSRKNLKNVSPTLSKAGKATKQ